MKRIYQIAALPFIGLGIFIVWESRNLKYYTALGPGAGFLPFWVGAILTVLSLLWLGQVSLKTSGKRPEDFIPNRSGWIRIVTILSAIVLCVVLLGRLGFSLTMFGFLAFLLFALGRQNLVVTLIIAVAGSIGINYAFAHWLGVYLPRSFIGFLTGLGL